MDRFEDRVYRCCEIVASHFVDMDEVKRNTELYVDEYDMAVAILSGCLIECIQKEVDNFNLDTARGLLYCTASQMTCAEEPDEKDFDGCAQMLVTVFERGVKEFGR